MENYIDYVNNANDECLIKAIIRETNRKRTEKKYVHFICCIRKTNKIWAYMSKKKLIEMYNSQIRAL